MPQQNGAKKRRKTFFARIPSTFTNNNLLSSVSSITEDNGKLLHSKSTYFYRWGSRKKLSSRVTFLIPSACVLVLTIGLGIAVNPSANAEQVYADSIIPMSVDPDSEANISLIMGANSGEFNPTDTTATTVTADQVTFRPYRFQVKYAQTSQYAIQINSMNGYGNNLRGKDNPTALITGVGENKTPDQFSNNTWGFALAQNSTGGSNLTNTDYTKYRYNTVPEYSAQTGQNTKIVDVEVNPDLNQSEAQTDDWTLSFAAKIGSDSPADHYISKVYLSVVHTPGRVYTVTYNANKPAGVEGDVTGTPVETKFVETGKTDETFRLSPDVPKLQKYRFLGWSTTQITEPFAKNDLAAATAAVTYEAGGDIDLKDFSTPAEINLYAVWIEGAGLLGLTTMQEMSNKICMSADTFVGDTTRLKDERDGKYYWVAKLRDGNCWMTQNLDYDVPQTLKAADTNVAADTTLPAFTAITDNTDGGVSKWLTIDNILAYYDPGIIIKRNPATTEECGYNVYKLTESTCVNAGWIDLNADPAYADYSVKEFAPQTDELIVTSTEDKVLDQATKLYDAHYLIGNYYSWNLATANTGKTISATGTQARNSICPKGWKLPTSGTQLSQYPTLTPGNLSSYDISGSFAYLFRQYGLATSYSAGQIATDSYSAYDAPLYFLRSGIITNTSSASDQASQIYEAGAEGHYASSVASANHTNYTFVFMISNSRFNPSYDTTSFYGSTIRCVHDPGI